MAIAIAKLNNYRQSPRKVRLVADSIKGKNVNDAINHLDFLAKRASSPILKLLNSAISNAKSDNLDLSNLIVLNVRVDSGKIMYRRMPVARGAAHPIRKRTSHIILTLAEGVKSKKVKVSKDKTKKDK